MAIGTLHRKGPAEEVRGPIMIENVETFLLIPNFHDEEGASISLDCWDRWFNSINKREIRIRTNPTASTFLELDILILKANVSFSKDAFQVQESDDLGLTDSKG
ncbi:hypothetical protein GOBAR_AA11610 [Gossypium barbadense]|uniref:Uncharacterized protein n=1 Tax=Gossypium barbadense TaxID=3634 RepID=A0A2P5Y094_GOSBA|nr:hypothetical protein GOBAR_AA11610 [Gossypium barbadense]